MVDVLLRFSAEYDNIVEIYESKLQFRAGQDLVHCTSESAGCIAKFERHTCKAMETMI